MAGVNGVYLVHRKLRAGSANQNDFTPQIIRYAVVAMLSSALEAFSVQNDNLTLPLYMWSMLAVVDV